MYKRKINIEYVRAVFYIITIMILNLFILFYFFVFPCAATAGSEIGTRSPKTLKKEIKKLKKNLLITAYP